MAILDPIFDAAAAIIDTIVATFDALTGIIDFIQDPTIVADEGTAIIGQLITEAGPQDDVGAALVDTIEESILTEVQQAGELTPENVEGLADDTEGAAVAALAGIAGVGTALEAASLGQVDQHTEYLTQALAGLGVEQVTGLELDARLQEGIQPALEAKVGKEHRAKFVSEADAVEHLLRNKDGDTGYLQGRNVDGEAYDRVQSNSPENPENALEEWGIRDDQLPILESVALEAMEFEELIETPAELGLIVDDDVLDLVLDLAGYPEDLKDFLRQVPQEIPRSNRIWEERTAVEPSVNELETLAADGEIDPQAAIDLLPDAVEPAKPALRDRFANLQELPSGPPTRSLIEDSALLGLTSIPTLEERLERLEYDTETYSDIVDTTILKEIDGDLRQALALGFISPGEYGELMDRVGLDEQAQQRLVAGDDLSDIVDERLQEQAGADSLPVSAIPGIGESRTTALEAAGFESVAQLAQADVQAVAEAANVSPETAEGWIGTAQQAVSGGS